ncbi:unnamed protein product [Albugo candida]|uniref:Uncharacterized protein n=1 Tax=Albugo candida TaxID=65357 RepID=A0A024FYW0_9STRA|nr:unnamed protein product [Albugo candida]|eukprot:CCI39473.1 unnamed protein product [Albugo candida]
MSDLQAVPPINWPLDRINRDVVDEADIAAVDRYFFDSFDQPLMIQWVLQYKQKNFQRRLLVVFPLDIYTFKKKGKKQALRLTKLKLCKRYQWICLEALQIVSPETGPFHTVSVRLIFDMKKSFNIRNCHNNLTRCSSLRRHFFRSKEGLGTHCQGCISRHVLHLHAGTQTEFLARLSQRIIHNLHLLYTHEETTGDTTQYVLPAPHFEIPAQLSWLEFIEKKNSLLDVAARFDFVVLAYRARCDDMGIQYRQDTMRRTYECICSSDSLGEATLDLQYCLSENERTDCTNVNWRRETRPLSLIQKLNQFVSELINGDNGGQHSHLEAEILLQVLLSCPFWFAEITVSDRLLTSPETKLLSRLIARSKVNRVTMRNVGMDESMLANLCKYLHEGFTENTKPKEHQVKLLECDFSYNDFDAHMVNALGNFFTPEQSLAMSQLNMQNCSLSADLSTTLLKRIKSVPALSFSLRVLNLSNNTLGTAGTRALSSWISTSSSLQILELANVKLDLDVFSANLSRNTILYESSLTRLDISYNVLQERASDCLGWMLGKTQSLSTLMLRGMRRREVKLDFCSCCTLKYPQSKGYPDEALLEQIPSSVCLIMRRFLQTVCRSRNKSAVNYLKSIVHPFLLNDKLKKNSHTTLDLSENDMSGWRAYVMAELFQGCSSCKRRLKLYLDACRLHGNGVRHELLPYDAIFINKLFAQALVLIRNLSSCKLIEAISMNQNGFTLRRRQLRLVQEDERVYRTERNNANFAFEDERAELSRTKAFNHKDYSERSRRSFVDRKVQAIFPTLLIDILENRIDSATNLKELYLSSNPEEYISNDRRMSSWGKTHFVYSSQVIKEIVDALAINTSLRLLDVSGNLCGNSLAFALGYTLPENSSLEALYWDMNCTNVIGFTAFLAGLKKNQTLSFVQMPIRDIQRILEEDISPRGKLFAVLSDIFRHVESRSGTKKWNC